MQRGSIDIVVSGLSMCGARCQDRGYVYLCSGIRLSVFGGRRNALGSLYSFCGDVEYLRLVEEILYTLVRTINTTLCSIDGVVCSRMSLGEGNGDTCVSGGGGDLPLCPSDSCYGQSGHFYTSDR